MKLKLTALFFVFLTTKAHTLHAQDSLFKKPVDSARRLKEVIIHPYFSTQSLLRGTGSVSLANQQALSQQPSSSLVSAMNTISGVRMEERSPGSYRLSIRGSLLRSPFGVRNIKIYFDDFPLTDAGGNTYLNALDGAGVSQIQVLKGPQASIYGANSGGVVLIQPQGTLTEFNRLGLKLEAGSYGSFREAFSCNRESVRYALNLTQTYQRSDGYRDHSSMNRKYIQALQKFAYQSNTQLKMLLFYSDLQYNTPGGLTAGQYDANPRTSRPAAGAARSAAEQQAGIYSKTLYGGLSHEWQISPNFRHLIAVYSSYTDFRNPFITNYEKRKEFTAGLRSYLEYTLKKNNADWKFNLGVESMQTATDFDNFENNLGVPGAVFAADDLKASANFAFAHLSVDLHEKLLAELSSSANLFKYTYKSIVPVCLAKRQNTFDLQLMPRAALSYLATSKLSARASVSKGYSPPTLAEVRGSNNIINTELQPEYGWNYETGMRYHSSDQKWMLDLNGFYYHLRQAITRRVDESDAEYFINTGGTKQWGVESNLSCWVLPARTSGLVRSLQARMAYTFSHFRFDNYADPNNNYSGNALSGVPKTILVSSADIQFPRSYRIFLQHNYTSAIPLNDANTIYASRYHLVQVKTSKTFTIGHSPVELYIGVDNLLNQKYSLGNDLNAFGGRYFNAAALRNFYGGLSLKL